MAPQALAGREKTLWSKGVTPCPTRLRKGDHRPVSTRSRVRQDRPEQRHAGGTGHADSGAAHTAEHPKCPAGTRSRSPLRPGRWTDSGKEGRVWSHVGANSGALVSPLEGAAVCVGRATGQGQTNRRARADSARTDRQTTLFCNKVPPSRPRPEKTGCRWVGAHNGSFFLESHSNTELHMQVERN